MKRKDFSKLKIEVQKEKDNYFEHEDYIAGVAPFLRGIHTTMYLQTPLKRTDLTDIRFQENTAPAIELAQFLKESYNYIQKSIQKGTPVEDAVSSLLFKTTINDNHFGEISKMRALRMLWAKMIKSFNPKNQDALALKIQAIVNNTTNTSTAIFGGCQSVAKEATYSLFFEEETGILKTVDPWAGSLYIEKRTEEIANQAWLLFKEEHLI